VLDDEFTRLLETHCAQARIQVEPVGYVIDNDKAEFVSLNAGIPYEFTDTDSLLGIVHLVINRQSAHASVFSALARIGRPVSILDEIGGWYAAAMMPRNLAHRIISVVSGKGPGHDMAHYCIDQGYRNIAYFSPFYSEQWSQSRYSGLTDIFSGNGCERKAHLFPIEGHERIWSYYDDGIRRARMHDFVRSYTRWLEKIPDEFAFTIEPLLRRASREQCARGEIYVQLVPLFEKALLNNDIRAWVFDGDAFALMALDFLRRRGVDVPKRIALVSFNDSLDALEGRLTSYHFNVAASLNAMLDFIASPSSYRWKRMARVVEIRGTVIKRDTG
jgi:hypothetical protein